MTAIASHLLFNSLLLAALLASSHSMLKWVSAQPADNYLVMVREHWLMIGASLAIYGFIFFYYLFVLRFQQLSSIYPVYTGLSILLVFLSGILIFKESVSVIQIVGCLLIIAGIAMVTTTR